MDVLAVLGVPGQDDQSGVRPDRVAGRGAATDRRGAAGSLRNGRPGPASNSGCDRRGTLVDDHAARLRRRRHDVDDRRRRVERQERRPELILDPADTTSTTRPRRPPGSAAGSAATGHRRSGRRSATVLTVTNSRPSGAAERPHLVARQRPSGDRGLGRRSRLRFRARHPRDWTGRPCPRSGSSRRRRPCRARRRGPGRRRRS